VSCTTNCRKPNGNQAHCGACHQTFAGITGFDHHRVGPVDERVCVPPAERGLHLNAHGVWSLPSGGKYWIVPPQVSDDAVAAEQPSLVAEHASAHPEGSASAYPFSVVTAELPPGVSALVISSVEPDEIREGESVGDALARLNRAVAIRDDA
jgi:hypothetical protein